MSLRSRRRRHPRAPGARRLTPVELAEAAVLVDVSLVLCVLGWLLPYGGAFFVAAVVPVVALAARQRVRAVAVGLVAGAALAFIVGGTGLTVSFLESGILGAFVGWGRRRAWGRARTVVVTVALVWPVAAAATVGLLLVFSDLRRLTFDQVRNSWSGLARILRNIGLQGVAHAGDVVVSWSITHWYVVVPVVLLVVLVAVTWLAQTLSHAVVPRVVVGRPHARLGIADRDGRRAGAVADDDHAGPVPARFADVTFRYPGEPQPTLERVSLTLDAGRFVVVTGPNGAGKSSLSRVLAGAGLESGVIERPGAVALGRPGGTAMLFQRPESQVLGVRVRDDVVWGLHAEVAHGVDVEALLAQVGLAGLADRETSTLSGGQLQRLALASALARAPSLLVSDESTAMVDTAGRRRLLDLLRGLTARGTTVVHVTHRYGEIEPADGLLRVERGRVIAAAPPPSPDASIAVPATGPGGPVLEVRDAGYVYSPGTPWEHRALRGVTTTVHDGEAVLVLGANGSGKSTFAWLLAGLLHPTEGDVLLDGEPVTRHVGAVGLAFQHARLQLLRPTVRGELAVVAPDEGSLVRALGMVGLDASIAARPIDALSGGQQRRVLLARLLATGSGVLVLDEPFAGLDDDARVALADVLARLRATRAVAIVVVSHDVDDAAPFADRVVGLRDGTLVLDEPATTFDRSVASDLVAEVAT